MGTYTVLSYLILFLVIVSLFIKSSLNKTLNIVLLSFALWLPLYGMINSMGVAIEKRPTGIFKIVTSIVPDYSKKDIYLLIKDMHSENPPRLHKIELNREEMNRIRDEGSDYDQEVFRVQRDGSGAYELVYVDFEPPDLQKGDVQRSYEDREQ